ncbi:MAG: MoxR family ATPase, partial [Bacteroidia bacterium]|nr:MoxR family ATPase [Bacteroidia bacterium]
MENTFFANRIDLTQVQEKASEIKKQIGIHVVGQDQMIELLLIAVLADGHVLLEGVPGVAKTLTAKLLAKTIHAEFKRIQFTPDLMPSDIIGTSVFNVKTNEFEFKKGPLFGNIILADEINRAPAKTQAALFEAMEERQITTDGKTWPLEPPFLVLATQNPIEQEGTYRLPEAQLDRFLFKIEVGYPTHEEETKIIANFHERKNIIDFAATKTIINSNDIKGIREAVFGIHVENNLIAYIAKIVNETRNNPALFLGASPRASIAILNGAKACAALRARDFVTPDDIKFVTPHVLKHRVVLTPE